MFMILINSTGVDTKYFWEVEIPCGMAFQRKLIPFKILCMQLCTNIKKTGISVRLKLF